MAKRPSFSLKEVAPCLFAIFIDILGLGIATPLLVALFTAPDLNIFQIASPSLRHFFLGLTLALYPLLMFFGTSFIGDLSDVFGRKKTLLFSMIGMAFSFFLIGAGIALSSITILLIGRGLSGFVSASQSVALATISDLSTKSNKAIHLSYVAIIQCMGFVIGPLMGGILSGASFYTPFLGAGLMAIVAALWIAFAFTETFLKKSGKTISIKRFFEVFIEAYQNKPIRKLSLIFFTMQVGIGLYLPIILILLIKEFRYTPLDLGIFNGYIGVGFALGLLFILPRMLKRYKIEQIVCLSLFTTFGAQFFSSFFHSESILWLLAFPLAIAVELAFSGMFTSFSNAADERSQGWVMGVSVAMMAIAWAVAGFAAQLAPVFGARKIIFVGSVFLGISAILMKKYSAGTKQPFKKP